MTASGSDFTWNQPPSLPRCPTGFSLVPGGFGTNAQNSLWSVARFRGLSMFSSTAIAYPLGDTDASV